jgi:osmotically-inducible protein OsmY
MSFNTTTLHRAILLSALVSIGAAGIAAQAAPPADKDLKDRIEHRLDADAAVHKYDVKVSVNGGVATLTGSVATAAQKTEAARVAHVTGVTKVDNQITVDPKVDQSLADKAKAGMSKTGETINDAWITTKVHYHFMGEDTLKGSDINVDTADHTVTLKGTVRSAAAKTRAEVLARQTEGVTKVVNQLTVSTKK